MDARREWTGLFYGVPFPLYDSRPRGYLGRIIAHRLARELGLAERLTDWQEQHVLAALTQAGDDNPGALLLGSQAYERHMRRLLAPAPVPPSTDLARWYDHLAGAALVGEAPGSSAAGEQPKVATLVGDPPRHVIVKFSPERTTSLGERWADLLVCEHLAHEVVRGAGIETVRSRIIDGPRRRFLEVERFDRVGAVGRRPAVSLFAVDAEYFGLLDSWPESAVRLAARGWLSAEAGQALAFLWQFSALIANTDRHFGNVTLIPRDDGFELAPMYDVLPMLFAPQSGEIIERTFEVPIPAPGHLDVYRRALPLAASYWRAVASDERISEGFRERASGCASQVLAVAARMG